jgi:hypothetical protein
VTFMLRVQSLTGGLASALLSAAKLAAWLMPGKNCRWAARTVGGRAPPRLFSFRISGDLDWHADRMGGREAASSGAHASFDP